MAITENKFTAAELATAIQANPDLLNEVTSHLTSQEYTVHSKDAHAQYLKNYEQGVINPKISELGTRLDTDIEALTGIKKGAPEEKYYDYMKRAFTEKFNGLTTELENLKKKGHTSDVDKQRIEALEKAINEQKAEYEGKLKSSDDTLRGYKITSVIENALAKKRPNYKAAVPKAVALMAEGTAVAALQKQIRIEKDSSGNEIAVILGPDGKVLLNQKTFQALTVEEKLDELLSDMVEDKKSQQGGGSDPNKSTQEPGKFTGVPPTVKTKLELTEYLISIGIGKNTDEFTKIFSEHGAKLPLR